MWPRYCFRHWENTNPGVGKDLASMQFTSPSQNGEGNGQFYFILANTRRHRPSGFYEIGLKLGTSGSLPGDRRLELGPELPASNSWHLHSCCSGLSPCWQDSSQPCAWQWAATSSFEAHYRDDISGKHMSQGRHRSNSHTVQLPQCLRIAGIPVKYHMALSL